jgi:hypothetical protein
MTNDERKEALKYFEDVNAEVQKFREMIGEESTYDIERAHGEAINIAESLSESLYYGHAPYIDMNDFVDLMRHLVALKERIREREIPIHLLEDCEED